MTDFSRSHISWSMKALFFASLILMSTAAASAESDESIELHVMDSGKDSRGAILRAFDTVWDPILNQDPAIIFGAFIQGPAPYRRNSANPFRPASTSKLFTTLAALERFGSDHQFETRLQWCQDSKAPGTAKEVTLLGSGDPSWGIEELGETYLTRVQTIAQALKNQGISRIIGPVQVQALDPRFAISRVPEGWVESDTDFCYGALGQAFNLQLNCSGFVITGPNTGHFVERGVPTSVRLNIRIDKQTYLFARREGEGFVISGTWAKRSRPVEILIPVPNVTEWVRRLFLRALEAEGITLLDPSEEPESTEPEPLERLSFFSPKLGEIIKPFLKRSFNPIGDSLFRILGGVSFPQEPDLVNAGQMALKDFVAQLGAATAAAEEVPVQPGYYADQAILWDGAGLSHLSQVTPDAMMILLEDAFHRQEFEALWKALPIAGVDGTLRNRMRGTPAQNVLRAKTGTLVGTYNLSGFVPRIESDGQISRFVPFVILTRTTAAHSAKAHAIEDLVGARLAEQVNSSSIP